MAGVSSTHGQFFGQDASSDGSWCGNESEQLHTPAPRQSSSKSDDPLSSHLLKRERGLHGGVAGVATPTMGSVLI